MSRQLSRYGGMVAGALFVLCQACSGMLPEHDLSVDGSTVDQVAEVAPAEVVPEVAPAEVVPEVALEVVAEVEVDLADAQAEVDLPAELVEEIEPVCFVDGDCDDGNYCTVDKCIGGACLQQEVNCYDGNKCTDDWCDPDTGLCVYDQLDCDDGDVCTIDKCAPGAGCSHEEIPDCCAGTPVKSEDFEGGLPWTVVVEHQPEGNSATWQVVEGKPHGGSKSLYFGSAATGNYDFGGRIRAFVETPPMKLHDTISSQMLFWIWMNIESSINYDTFTASVVSETGVVPVWGKEPEQQMKKWKVITIDLQAFRGQTVKFRFAVDTIDGHDNDYTGVYLDDFKLLEMCPDAGCKTKVECSDGLPCTEGQCVGGKCQYSIVSSCCLSLGDCLDADPCTLDACKSNTCDPVVLKPPYCCYEPGDCEDDNICTKDICDESGICLHPPSQAPGCCKVDTDCDDGDPCTDNKCNPDNSSCYFPQNSVPCNDKNACTKNDKCTAGICTGESVVCDDKNQCTYDLCEPQSGCYYPTIPQGAACNDLNACTENDVCLLGNCAGEWTPGCCLKDTDCNDSDNCTIDKCTANVCQNINTCCFSDAECNDFDDICTNDACVGGGCVYTPTGVEGCCQQVYFRDDFSTDKGWEYGPEWERKPAASSGGQSYGNGDPATDHTTTADNHVAGVKIGGNASQVPHDFYWLTSPAMDTSNASNLRLYFWRWLNSDYASYMVNAVDVYAASGWKRIWETGGAPGVQDGSWAFQNFDVTQHKNSSFRVRMGFNIGSSGVFAVSSWNVDDVTIVDMPAPGGPGICCGHDSDCQGVYTGMTCKGGECSN